MMRIAGGLTQEIEYTTEQIDGCLTDADWIDAHEPYEDERKLLERMPHTDLPESNEVEEIEASTLYCFFIRKGWL